MQPFRDDERLTKLPFWGWFSECLDVLSSIIKSLAILNSWGGMHREVYTFKDDYGIMYSNLLLASPSILVEAET